MTRTVIRVEELVNLAADTQLLVRPEEPQDVLDFDSPSVLGCSPTGAPFADLAAVGLGHGALLANNLVRLVGEGIYAGLSVHKGVGEALERASRTAVGAVHPILVASSASGAESLPFEVLYHHKEEFLALDPRWPMARVVGRGRGRTARFMRSPLRVAVVLAAANREGAAEWDAFRQAVDNSQVDVNVTVFVAHDLDAAHVNAGGAAWVDVRYMPLTDEDLITELRGLRPQVLHVFSHGSAQYGGFLELATRNSVQLGHCPIFVTARHLARLGDLVWLVTLNACEGAAPAASMHSLAYSLVEQGVPAAVGMREAIDSADASAFCRAFYTSALGALAAAAVPGARFAPDWSEPLRAARVALCARLPGPTALTASGHKAWTLPVLYRLPEDLVVQVARNDLTMGDEEQERTYALVENLQQSRDAMPAGTPESVLAALDAEIAAARGSLY